MTQFFTILTRYGITALAEAIATDVPLKIRFMGVGDGGGAYYEPTEEQTNLRNEKEFIDLNDLRPDASASGQVIAEAIIPLGIEGDWTVREIGLYDENKHLIAVGKYPETYIPSASSGAKSQVYIQVVVKIGNVAAVELMVNHDLALASKQLVYENGVGLVGSFEYGLINLETLSTAFQLVYCYKDQMTYRWDGQFPKSVAANSTLESTGGVCKGAWLPVNQNGSKKFDARIFGINAHPQYSDNLTNDGNKLSVAMSSVGTEGILHFPLPFGWNQCHYLIHVADLDWGQCWLSADRGVILHAANTNDDEGKKPRLLNDVIFSQQVPHNPIDYSSERGCNDYDLKSAMASAIASSASLSTKTFPLDFTKAANAIKYAGLGPGTGITYSYNATGTVLSKDQVYFDANSQSAYCGVALATAVGSEFEVLIENTGSINSGLVIVGFKALSVNGGTSTTLAAHFDIANNQVNICNGSTVMNTVTAPFPTDILQASIDNGVRAGARVLEHGLVAFTLNGRVIGTLSTSSVFAREFILLVDDNARKGIRFKYGFYRIRDKVNYTKPLTIACLGDSITRGARTSNEWPRLLEAYAEHLPGVGRIKKLTNFGVSGRTLRGFVADITSLNFQGFDYTLIQLGTNDCQNKGNIGQFYNDVITLGNKVIEDGSIPIFAVFPKFTSSSITGNGNATNNAEYIAKYQSVIRWAAESRGWKVVFVDDFFGDNCGMAGDYDNSLKISNSWCHDNIHPNTRGSIAVAAAFANALTSHLSYESTGSMTEKLSLTSDSTAINEVSHGLPMVTLSGNTVSISGALTCTKNQTVIAKLPVWASPSKSIFQLMTSSSGNTWASIRVEIRPNGDLVVGSDFSPNGQIEIASSYNI